MGHVNIFKTKSKEELIKLYGEFLKVDLWYEENK